MQEAGEGRIFLKKPCLEQDRALRSVQLNCDRLEVLAVVKTGGL